MTKWQRTKARRAARAAIKRLRAELIAAGVDLVCNCRRKVSAGYRRQGWIVCLHCDGRIG